MNQLFIAILKKQRAGNWFILVVSLFFFVGACYFVFRCKCYNTDSLTIVPRAGWGAADMNVSTSGEKGIYDEYNNPGGIYHYKLPLQGKFTTVVIHHSALPTDLGVKYIQELHMRVQSFGDIGYHFVIDKNGQVFEGRDIGTRGAHVKGHNTGTIGVVLLGNFQETDPSSCQKHTLVMLLRHLHKVYLVNNLTMHLRFNPKGTVCPGTNLVKLLGRIAKESGMNYLRD